MGSISIEQDTYAPVLKKSMVFVRIVNLARQDTYAMETLAPVIGMNTANPVSIVEHCITDNGRIESIVMEASISRFRTWICVKIVGS